MSVSLLQAKKVLSEKFDDQTGVLPSVIIAFLSFEQYSVNSNVIV